MNTHTMRAAWLGTVLATGFISPGSADTLPGTCAPRAEIAKRLADQFGEETIAVGLAEQGSIILEVLTAADGSTWTVLFSSATGLSCLVASGENWKTIVRHPTGQTRR